jgi:hypothetical protein
VDAKQGVGWRLTVTVRVYKSEKCNVGWTLQPLQDGTCSGVGVFGSIMVVGKGE